MQLPKSPSFDLDGKRALVTGGSKGIGLAAACSLARAGAHTTLVARGADRLKEVEAALSDEGHSVDSMALDMADIDATRDWIERQEPFDILVNNAGAANRRPAIEIKEDEFDSLMSLNVRGAWFVATSCAKLLIEAKKPGSIINMSSQMGHVSWPQRALYSASKHAVEGFTKAMALEWGEHGIRVNTLCPTYIKTDLTEKMLADEEFSKAALERLPLGRFGNIEDLMGAILFLASDASSLVTGTALLVDGGWTAQ